MQVKYTCLALYFIGSKGTVWNNMIGPWFFVSNILVLIPLNNHILISSRDERLYYLEIPDPTTKDYPNQRES